MRRGPGGGCGCGLTNQSGRQPNLIALQCCVEWPPPSMATPLNTRAGTSITKRMSNQTQAFAAWMRPFLVGDCKPMQGGVTQEQGNAIVQAGLKYVSKRAVALITETDLSTSVSKEETLKKMRLASGIIVRADADSYGILTAAHNLKREGNTKHLAGITVCAAEIESGGEEQRTKRITLTPREFTQTGFDNEDPDGPDVAIIPLQLGEWNTLKDYCRMEPFDLRENQFPTNPDKAPGPPRACIELVVGNRYKVSRIRNANNTSDGMVRICTYTLTSSFEAGGCRDGYDITHAHAGKPVKDSVRCWPGENIRREIEALEEEGVTKEAMAGMSGCGFWRLIIGLKPDMQPTGQPIGALAGVCFYADPDGMALIGNGPKAIEQIRQAHASNQAGVNAERARVR